jgi:predicted amidohydrolase YtcJ
MLIAEPGIHHAHIHVILLGIELILEVLWPYFDELESKIKAKLHKDNLAQ